MTTGALILKLLEGGVATAIGVTAVVVSIRKDELTGSPEIPGKRYKRATNPVGFWFAIAMVFAFIGFVWWQLFSME